MLRAMASDDDEVDDYRNTLPANSVLEDYRINVAKMDGPRVVMVRIEPKLVPPPNPRPSA